MSENNMLNRVDASFFIFTDHSSDNVDPDTNAPRMGFDGRTFLSHEFITRRIRNRLQDEGLSVCFQMDGRVSDEFKTVKDRAEYVFENKRDNSELREIACKTWIDIRTLGGLFPYKVKLDGEKSEVSRSLAITAPISIPDAYSINVPRIIDKQITKSFRVDKDESEASKESSSFARRTYVECALYRVNIRIDPLSAERNGVTEEDLEHIKMCLRTLFRGDSSSMRPGSMYVVKGFWWNHNTRFGTVPVRQVFDSVKAYVKEGVEHPVSMDDFAIEYKETEGATLEVLDEIC